MDSIYGTVVKSVKYLAKFYSARQEPDEIVSSWSCRLETLLSKAVEGGQVESRQTNDMLCTMLWQGLCSPLKDVTAHILDRIKVFDELRVAIRRSEEDQNQRTTEEKTTDKKHVATSKAAIDTPSAEEGGLKEIKGIVQQLAADVKSMKEDNKQRRDSDKGYQQ
ncbi:hypothetical protein KP79_PYT25870 [Mizuhopecten yessoensis]|uniref:Paraneoplastic antigen Ma-like C-terminal domain-containing protein n=1 Tax=Mizuhopecten yessoensis TaxID=6573 RepID=A0A210PKK3_MIZYE|nr:hypothetical protein KP79_PYT25870 [Mizuhopecten yessoensis]